MSVPGTRRASGDRLWLGEVVVIGREHLHGSQVLRSWGTGLM